MKKIIHLFLLTPSFLFGQVMVEDFEGNRHLNYAEKSGEFISDNDLLAPPVIGGMYDGVANPDMSGINTSARCGSYQRNEVETFDYFITLPSGGFTNLTDFTSGENFFTLDVWSPEPSTSFIISFENREIAQIDPDSTDGVHSRFEAFSTVAEAWQTITFSFLDFPDLNISEDQIDQMVFLVNNNQLDNGVVVYFDNLVGPDYGCMDEDPNQTIEDFECQRNLVYTFTHGALSYVSNPDPSGINTSEKVGFYESIGQGDENNNDVTLFNFDQPIAFNQNNRISMKVKSSFSKNVQLTLQGGGNSYSKEIELDGSDTWKEYTFNYSDILDNAVEITQAILIFAPGETDLGYTFYYDDIVLQEVSSVDEDDKLNGITIVENFIYFSDFNSTKHIRIYDLSGKLVQSDVTNDNSLQIKSTATGLLMINITDNEGFSTTIKYLNK